MQPLPEKYWNAVKAPDIPTMISVYISLRNLPILDRDVRMTNEFLYTDCVDTAVLDVDSTYRKSNGEHQHHRVMSTLSVVAVTYFFGCGGPLGSEPIISSAGPAIGLPAMLLYPLLITGPYAFIVAELCCAFPEDGGFTVWVFNSCGPFWGFQILDDYYSLSISSGFASYLVKVAIAILLTLPCLIGTRTVSRTCVLLLACVLIPVLVFTIWGYSRARDFGDLFEVRHEMNIIHENRTDDEQVGSIKIDWALLLNTLFWAFDGINMASVFGGEVSNPARVYPRAIAFTVALTLLTYVIPIPAAILVDDPNWRYFNRDSYPALADAIGGYVLKAVFAFSSCCSVAGLFVSGIFCKSFQLSGMSDVQLLPNCFARRSTRFNAPYVSITVTLVFTIALLGIEFKALLLMTNAFAGAVQLVIIFAAVRLRKQLPYIPRPVRVPGGTRVLAALAGLPTIVLCYIVFDTFRSVIPTLTVLAFLVPGLFCGLYERRHNQIRRNWTAERL
ncbi:amino acid-polyamine-organocation family [Plasmopara halstedii]|uniref:Amino acid-polyamine-organocation family n=1 Tax=Plasmopara halstedii TaxID=4781 RepID=A0A0P1AYE2_PLAHL|nr:amino acid-polyamine-organocation family [Plasmopara halstedii]CEG45757.1 amino acid-polyamine-organocation family [Plasmopara halstedii]|eukprot:XP_024582126.1 amino acid-polyamine-organocation family [Plasmopara halstedii]